MHVYNTIVVLKEILPVFPIAKVHEISGMMVWKAIEKLLETEQRNDLKILANAYVLHAKFHVISAYRQTQVPIELG